MELIDPNKDRYSCQEWSLSNRPSSKSRKPDQKDITKAPFNYKNTKNESDCNQSKEEIKLGKPIVNYR